MRQARNRLLLLASLNYTQRTQREMEDFQPLVETCVARLFRRHRAFVCHQGRNRTRDLAGKTRYARLYEWDART